MRSKKTTMISTTMMASASASVKELAWQNVVASKNNVAVMDNLILIFISLDLAKIQKIFQTSKFCGFFLALFVNFEAFL
jgi:hypothetical protein